MSDADDIPTTTYLNDGADLEIAHPEDFGINRDESGDLIPIAQRIPGTDMAVRVKPLVGGAVDRWDDVLDADSADDDRTDQFLREYVVEGIGSGGLDSCPDYLVPAIIEAIKNSSGYEVFREMQQRREEENLRMLEQMDNVPDELMMTVLGATMGNNEEIDDADMAELRQHIGDQDAEPATAPATRE